MQAERYDRFKRIAKNLQGNNEYKLTDEERTIIKLRGISEARYLTEVLVARIRAAKSPSEDKKNE